MANQTPPPVPSRPPPISQSPITAAIILFKVYCGVIACFGLAWTIMGAFYAMGKLEPQLGIIDTIISSEDEDLRKELLEEEANQQKLMLIVGPCVLVSYLFGMFLPRKKWAPSVAITLLVVSLIGCLTVAFAIPLMIYINRRESRAYFNNYSNFRIV